MLNLDFLSLYFNIFIGWPSAVAGVIVVDGDTTVADVYAVTGIHALALVHAVAGTPAVTGVLAS
jgi:hypothetical protein